MYFGHWYFQHQKIKAFTYLSLLPQGLDGGMKQSVHPCGKKGNIPIFVLFTYYFIHWAEAQCSE